MAFRDNSTLITTAAAVDVSANNADDTYDASGGATAFVIANGNVGDDTFLNFGSDDSLHTGRAIFDGNGDGYIQFGPNGVLDVDRTRGGESQSARGPDQLQLSGMGDTAITEIRFLGSKGGVFSYADSATRRNLFQEFGQNNVVEGTVGDDTIDAGSGSVVILHDNALGLNLGGDTINGFGDDDLLVTTELLFDSDSNDTIEFFDNDVLDVSSGDQGAQGSDPSTGPGGQLDLNSPDQLSVEYLGSNEINGVTYYYYGTAGSTFDPGADA